MKTMVVLLGVWMPLIDGTWFGGAFGAPTRSPKYAAT